MYCFYVKAHLAEVMETEDFEDFFRMVVGAGFRDEVDSKFRELVHKQFKRGKGNSSERVYNYISMFSPSRMKCVDTVTN